MPTKSQFKSLIILKIKVSLKMLQKSQMAIKNVVKSLIILKIRMVLKMMS